MSCVVACSEGNVDGVEVCEEPGCPVATTRPALLVGGELNLQVGASQQLSATVVDSSGSSLSLQATSWTSTDETVASVSGDGLLTGVGVGTTNIVVRATLLASGTELLETVTVTVTDDVDAVPPEVLPLECPGDTEAATLLTDSEWQNTDLNEPLTGGARLELFARSSAPEIDALVGIGAAPATTFGDVSAILRFANTGFFDVRDGASYRSDNSIPFVADQWYAVRFDLQIERKTYDVYVAPCGEDFEAVLRGAAFRSNAPSATEFSALSVWSSGEGSLEVSDVVASEITVEPAPDPGPGPEPDPDLVDGSGELALSVLDVEDPESGDYTASPSQLVAPAGYFFRASGSNFGVDNHFMDIRYKWNFDDPDSLLRNNQDFNSSGTAYEPTEDFPWDRVYEVDGTRYVIRGPKVYDAATDTERPSLSSVLTPRVGYEPNFGSSRTFLGYWGNVAYGPLVTHVFSKPGTYTVTCEARKRGETPVTETIRVTVLDPDDFYDDTYVVATDNNFGGAPSTPNRYTNVDDAIDAMNAGSLDRKRRLVLKRGQTHGDGGRLAPNSNMEAFGIYAFGSASAKPILRKGLFLNSNTTKVGVDGVHLRPGTYRARQPFNTRPERSAVEKLRNGWVSLHDLILDRSFHAIIFASQNRQGLIGQDIFAADWNRYGFFANNGGGGYGIKGFWFKTDVQAITGFGEDERDPPFYIDHGPQRSAPLGGPLYLGMCDLRSVGSRTAQTNDNSFQPNLRIGRGNAGRGPVVQEAVVDRCIGELGHMTGAGTASDNPRPSSYLWDKVYSASSIGKSGTNMFNVGITGLHFRNIVYVLPNIPNVGRATFISRDSGKTSARDDELMEEYGVALESSTIIDLRDYATNQFDIDRLQNGEVGNGTAQNPRYRPAAFVRVGNLVIEAPNKNIPDETDSWPLNAVEFRRSTYPGPRWGDAGGQVTGVNTDYAIPGGVYAFYFPESGSNALDAASPNDSAIGNGQGAHIPVDDFWGNRRGTSTSKGAFD